MSGTNAEVTNATAMRFAEFLGERPKPVLETPREVDSDTSGDEDASEDKSLDEDVSPKRASEVAV
jgi:hypothetical protein